MSFIHPLLLFNYPVVKCLSIVGTEGILSRAERRSLKERHASLDPFELKEELERRLGKILSPPTKAKNG